jgi:putative transposase
MANCRAQRFVWNYFLDLEIKQYQQTKKFRFYNQNSRDLTMLKKTEVWLNNIPSTSLQQTLRNLDQTLKTYFKRKHAGQGFPKFKKRRNFNGSFSLAMINAKSSIHGNKFYIPKVGDVKCRFHREIPSDFKTCQIKCEANKWFVVLTCTREIIQLPKTYKVIGIDINSKEYVTSDNQIIKIPKYLHENQVQIKKLQRKLARQVKNSARYKKTQLKLAKLHKRISNKRLDFFHKLSFSFVKDYDLSCLENLDVKAIQKQYGKVIGDNGFAMFKTFVVYKAILYGKETVIIDRWYPSSQLCSQCQEHRHKMPLSSRTYICPDCGNNISRDLNAAINIMKAGTALTSGNGGVVHQWSNIGALSADHNALGSYVL